MSKNIVKKTLSLLLTGIFAVLSSTEAFALSEQAEKSSSEIITVSSVEDFQNLCKRFSIDSGSKGKTVRLTANLNFQGMEFTPIPIFCGTFEGGNHTISGVKITSSGSDVGIFRYLDKGASINNLKVSAVIMPEGTKSSIGGIVGVNSGTITGCTFRGTVKGENNVGGIAGFNKENGQIVSCSSEGYVYGKNSTGGIAGRSTGVIIKCKNYAGINLTDADFTVNIMDLDAESFEQRVNGSSDDAYNLTNSYADTGGIVGYSGGIVQSCENSGEVGYPHVGYNAGGIAGRQSGYLAGCSNSGTIHGRKEVGGIVGQSEPYLYSDPSKETLEKIRKELLTLNDLIDKALDDAQADGDNISASLSSIKKHTDSAQASCNSMINQITDFADGNMSVINSLTADITNALDKMISAADDLAEAGTSMSIMSDNLAAAMDNLSNAVQLGDNALNDINKSVSELSSASAKLKDAASSFKEALNIISEDITPKDPNTGENNSDTNSDTDTDKALDQLETAANSLINASLETKNASEDLIESLRSAKLISDNNSSSKNNESGEQAPNQGNKEENGEGGTPIKPTENNIVSRLKEIWDKAEKPLKDAADSMEETADCLNRAFISLEDSLVDLDPLPEETKSALAEFKEAANNASEIGKLISSALKTISSAIKSITENGPAEFKLLGDSFIEQSEKLNNSVKNISSELESLNIQIKSSSDLIISDFKAINNQCKIITELIINSVTDLEGNVSDPDISDYITDASDQDIANTRKGKVADCNNTGKIEGDRNVGGIAGAMAIEFDLDPEDDLNNGTRLNKSYEIKSVLQNNINLGSIAAKKDCVGGIVGKMELGTVITCENYGDIFSNGGNYVGGIAGLSNSVVRNCYAKSTLSGGNYIGGITGMAKTLRDCYSIISVTHGTEYIGAVSGSVSDNGTVSDNRYLDTGYAAIDGISYEGAAQPVSYSDLMTDSNVPAKLTSFAVTFKAEDKEIDKIQFRYGDDLSKITLPQVPEKEDCYGYWEEFDTSGIISDITVNAEYAQWVTLCESSGTDGKLPLALVEGKFTDDVKLEVTDYQHQLPSGCDSSTKVWKVAVTGADIAADQQVPLRLINKDKEKADVWRLSGDKWEKLESVQNGSYLFVTVGGAENVLCIQAHSFDIIPLIIGIAAVLLIILAIVIIAKNRKKRAKIKTENSEEKKKPKNENGNSIKNEKHVKQKAKSKK